MRWKKGRKQILKSRDKIKLIIIFPSSLSGSKIGGSETFIRSFIKFAPEDFDIDFVGVSSDRNARPPRKWKKLRLGRREINFLPLFFEKDENRKTPIPLSLRFTIAMAFSRRFRTPGVLLFNRIEPAILFRGGRSPQVGVIHTDIEQVLKEKSEVLWSRLPLLYFILGRAVIPCMDAVYTVSKNTLGFYRSRYPASTEKFSLILNCVDVSVFYPVDESRMGIRQRLSEGFDFLPGRGKRILFVGRLQKVKAPLRLVDSFCEFHKKDKESAFIIIGEGNLKEEVDRHIKKLDIEDSVFLLGSISQRILADFYRSSDALLLTSNFEGMPTCVLEALSCGLPVVSTNVGEVKTVIRSGISGEVVESRLPSDISAALEKVLGNPDIYTKENCLEAVSEYTPQRVFKPLYEDIRALYKNAVPKESGYIRRRKVNILGVPVDRMNMDEAIRAVKGALKRKEKLFIVAANVYIVTQCNKDEGYRDVICSADMVFPDGMPLVWASRLLGHYTGGRVSGPDFFCQFNRIAEEEGYSCYLLGGGPGGAEKVVESLRRRHPRLKIAGNFSPPFGEIPDELSGEIVKKINAVRPDILWVGLGAPRQERWISCNIHKLNVGFAAGVGAVFYYETGIKRRAPRWMHRIGLEWSYRVIVQDPTLFWKKRYYAYFWEFILPVFAQVIRERVSLFRKGC